MGIRKGRELPYKIKTVINADEPYTVYYEKLRTAEGLLLCAAGLYLISNIYTDPVHTFSGSFIWYLIFGLLFLTAGLPLCFICSGGCVLVTDSKVIIYRTRCFYYRTLTAIPSDNISRACRISAGRKGPISAFFSFVSAFIKGEKEKAEDMRDAAFLNGYLEVCAEERSYKIRLKGKDADSALSDIGRLCSGDESGGERLSRRYSMAPTIICTAVSLIAVIIFGIALTAHARETVEKQYLNAVYLEDKAAYSLAYVEYAHLAERYDYRDSHFRSRCCYAQLEMSQGNFKEAVEQINALGDFEGKKDLLYSCALAVEQENSAALAAEIYTSLGDYEDCADRLKLIDDAYNAAVTAFEKGEFLSAAEGFSLLRDYMQTADYVALIADEAERTVPPQGNPENLSSEQILERCNEALPILELLSWDSECASLKALCEEYISIYTFD